MRKIARRSVLAGAALIPVAALKSAAQQSTGPVFSGTQRGCLEAFVNRLVPADEFGPRAAECGVVEYFDRSLAGDLANIRTAVLAGLDSLDRFSRENYAAPFTGVAPEKQDEVLTALESNAAVGFPNSAAFFAMIRRLTLEGMFGDPSYGGNRNFAGWDLIRYPGPRLAVSAEDQQLDAAVKPLRVSANGGSHAH